MYFASFTEFFQMGGHALYVWSAFGFSITLLLLLLLLPKRSEKNVLSDIRQQIRREQQQCQNNEDAI